MRRGWRFKTAVAFTLIELLIVVAIIAILAAIAVANFLEAQVRSKVSRVMTDMRSVATGLEAYCVDHNHYPPAWDWAYSEEALIRITTPVAYMSTLLSDLFNPNKVLWNTMTDPPGGRYADDTTLIAGLYVYMSFPEITRNTATAFQRDFQNFTGRAWVHTMGWQMRSMGPNLKDDVNVPYDATNGTISVGDIARFGPGQETLGRR